MGYLAAILLRLLSIYSYVLLFYCILSFLPRMDNGFIRFIESIVEPVLAPIRSVLFRIPALRNIPVDLSPIALYLIIQILEGILWSNRF